MIAIRLTIALLVSALASISGTAQECVARPLDHVETYSLKRDSATFVVTQFGTILGRPNMALDEDDRIVLLVPTTQQEARSIRIKRISATRATGTISIAGADAQLDRVPATSAPCVLQVVLSDFASGRGEVELERVQIDAGALKTLSLGRFDFAVNPLYTGAFTFGPVRSSLKDPAFAIIKRGSDSLVTQTRVGDARLLYAVMYTAFIWGKRDLDKPAKELWHRINPTLGMALKDLTDNAFAGVSVDLPFGVYLTYGMHVGKVTELDPESGVSLGQSYPGTSVPTRVKWQADQFFSATVDLRAALKLIKAATTTTL